MTDEVINNVREIAKLASREVIKGADGQGYVLVPEGFDLHQLPDVEPNYIIASREFTRLESLIDYITRFVPKEATCYIRASTGQMVVEAILNSARVPNESGFHENELHRARCHVAFDPDFSAWQTADRDFMDQRKFAEFVEDQSDVFREPGGAEMLEIAQTLKINRKVNWSNHVNLSNNAVNFQFQEDDDAKAGKKGQLRIPEKFTIALPVFKGSNVRYEAEVSLRYRLESGRLLIGFKIKRLDRIFDTAVDEAVKTISDTGATCFHGSP